MHSIIVTTKQQLDAAQRQRYERITIQGDLADKLMRSRKIATFGATSIAIITTATAGRVAFAPATGGLSLGVGAVGLAAAAAATGTSVASIVVASAIGISLIIAVFKNYNVIECRAGFVSLSLKK
jgi:hypothetical protein